MTKKALRVEASGPHDGSRRASAGMLEGDAEVAGQSSRMSDIEYRTAQERDVPGIRHLNQYWYERFQDRTTAQGFLMNAFLTEEIQGMVERQEVVVAEHSNALIGYYLVHSTCENESTAEKRQMIAELIRRGQLDDGRYVFLSQAAVHPEYTGLGISRVLLELLKRQVSDRFDYMLGFIGQDNGHAREVHLHSGWVLIGESERGHLALARTSDAKAIHTGNIVDKSNQATDRQP